MDINYGENHNSINIIDKFIRENEVFILYGENQVSLNIEKVIKNKFKKSKFKYIEYNSRKEEVLELKDKIIITSYHEIKIANELFQKFGFTYGKNFIFFDHILNDDYLPKNSIGLEFINFYNQNKNKFQEVFNILSDEYSKKIFYKILNLRSNLLNIERIKLSDLPTSDEKQLDYENNAKLYLKDLTLIENDNLKNHIAFTISLNTYSYFDIVTPKNKKVIINAGAYNTTSVMFSYFSPSAKIYAFEPQKSIHQDNVLLSKKFKNIKPINSGIWEKTTKVSFNIEEDQYTASSISKTGTNMIDVVSIDDFILNKNIEKVDFIKMDIEGAELEDLLGASTVIQTQKPDLAISIYHKPEHLYEIPLLIKKLLPEYKVYIEHNYYNYTETVCFATID